MEQREKVEKAVEEVRKFLQQDGGDCEVVDVKDNVVSIRLKGACKGCPFSTITLKTRIEALIKEQVPGIEKVVAVE